QQLRYRHRALCRRRYCASLRDQAQRAMLSAPEFPSHANTALLCLPSEPFIAAKHLYLDMATPLPQTLGALRASEFTPSRLARNVKDELRENLMAKLRDSGKTKAHLFPGIVGYEHTAIPQLDNAGLTRHPFLLPGLRGQAKSRILRPLPPPLDPACPYVAGSEVRDN